MNPEFQHYTLGRFSPLMGEVVEQLQAGALSPEEYPFVRDPQGRGAGEPSGAGGGRRGPSARSARTRSSWARRANHSNQDEGDPSGLGLQDIRLGVGRKRLVVFIIGGLTRSEMRVAHKLSAQLGRDIVLGSTNVSDPAEFITQMKAVSQLEMMDV